MADYHHNKELTIIGRAERVEFVGVTKKPVPAKVDTGADISSVWASDIKEADGTLSFYLFSKESPYYSQQLITLSEGEYRLTRIANSFGDKELRYVVKLLIRVQGRALHSSFTLADRSSKIYPVLLGRRMLKGKFLVDVSQGTPLVKKEKAKLTKLHVELSQAED
jgi:hypothetical protein